MLCPIQMDLQVWRLMLGFWVTYGCRHNVPRARQYQTPDLGSAFEQSFVLGQQ